MKRIFTAVLPGLLFITTLGLVSGSRTATPAVTNARPFTLHTLTVYPNPTRPGTTSVDGDIGTNSNTSYAVAHSVADCTDCSFSGTITTEHSVGIVNDVPLYSVIRPIMEFDTSALGTSVTIVSATLSVRSQAQHVDFQTGDAVRLVGNSIVSNVNYATSDFNSIGSASLANSDIPVANMQTGVYNDFVLNAAGLANINRTGVSHFGLRLVADINGIQPVPGTDPDRPTTGGALAFFDSAEVGQSAAPKLVITYDDGGMGNPPLLGASLQVSPLSANAPSSVTCTATSSLTGASFAWTLNGSSVGGNSSTIILPPLSRGSYLIKVTVTKVTPQGTLQATASATAVAN